MSSDVIAGELIIFKFLKIIFVCIAVVTMATGRRSVAMVTACFGFISEVAPLGWWVAPYCVAAPNLNWKFILDHFSCS